MPFYPVVPQKLLDAYIALARKHNDPATPKEIREIAKWEAHGMNNAVDLIYGSVTAGMMLCEADRVIMEEHDEPMCGGFLFEPRAIQ